VVTGSVGPASEATALPPVTESLGTEELRINSRQTVTFPGGTYRFSRITVNGGGRLEFTGPATLIVGEMDLNGNSITTAENLPKNLKIKVAGTGQVQLNGSSTFYGVIYAPEAQVSLNGSTRIFGAVTGRRIDGNGSVDAWYDEALQDEPWGGSNQVTTLSWRDLSIS